MVEIILLVLALIRFLQGTCFPHEASLFSLHLIEFPGHFLHTAGFLMDFPLNLLFALLSLHLIEIFDLFLHQVRFQIDFHHNLLFILLSLYLI